MKSSTQLDSAVFQLTPTRTRCDLVIFANGKTEKIASGLVNPFLAHLKTAQEQMAKGGYSIVLEPAPGHDSSWFVKGTVERFVRFVSTPEILERVYVLESEILQIEQAIAIQSHNEIGLNAVEESKTKTLERIEGSYPIPDPSEEKAIVLYTPAAHPPERKGSTAQERNSKVQLMKVLETRKTALQKEQGMAFARAVAAGFDIDRMAPLMSFAESFGASRLMDACVKFMELWKRKHETGQWVEIEAVEAMHGRSDLSDSAGIFLSNTTSKQWDASSEKSRKACADPSSGDTTTIDQPHPGNQDYFPGQFPSPLFLPWGMHSPPGTMPVFQGYPMQGFPYCQNYPGGNPYFQPYPTGEDPRLTSSKRRGRRRHSVDGNTVPETWEVDALKNRSRSDEELENEISESQEPRNRGGQSGRKQSDMVVIKNINYIASKRGNSSENESDATCGSETDEENGDLLATAANLKHKKYLRSTKMKGDETNSKGKLDPYEGNSFSGVADGGHWQAFQNCLLRSADEADHDMFAAENGGQLKRRENIASQDPSVFGGRDIDNNHERNMSDIKKISERITQREAQEDESLISRRMDQFNDSGRFMAGQVDAQSAEVSGRQGRYRRTINNDFMIHRQENQFGYASSSSVPPALNGYEHSKNDLDQPSVNMYDDSYVVSLRAISEDQGHDVRNAINLDLELPSSVRKDENLNGSNSKYQPDELNLMPERRIEKDLSGYDLALEYDMQIHTEKSGSLKKQNKEKGGLKGSKKSDKDQNSKLATHALDKKKKVGPIRNGKPSKLSPMDEARARANRLRTYKADLQKMKKEKEEEQIKRLEALKLERQKRIAARNSSIPGPSTLQQIRNPLPTKLSPSSHKSSKFVDTNPGSSSPLQRFPISSVSRGSINYLKSSKPSKRIAGSRSAVNRLNRSVSSLPEATKENGTITPDAKASMARIRRLSEPKLATSHYDSAVKPWNQERISKPKASDGPEIKKISAIMKYDQSKAASLSEIKIRTVKEPDVHGKSITETLDKVSGSNYHIKSKGNEYKVNCENISHDGDNPIIEKTIVVLESDKLHLPSMHTLEGDKDLQVTLSSDSSTGEKLEMAKDHAGSPRVLPLTMVVVGEETGEHQVEVQNHILETATRSASNEEKKQPKHSRSSSTGPYQPPCARISSLEDPCTGNSEYGKAPPANLQTETTGAETLKAYVSDSKNLKLEKIPEAADKPSKGIRQLLRFGRKNHDAGEKNTEPDNVSVSSGADIGVTNDGLGEVQTLKKLISQEESLSAGTSPQKTSRYFSLLSPFRSKINEKKG